MPWPHVQIFFVALILSSCSAVQDMQSVKTSSQSLSKTTDSLDKSAQDMRDTFFNTTWDLRQNEAMARRRELIQSMEQEKNLEGKLEWAVKYLMAFDFQFWKNQLSDTTQRRDELAADAVKELTIRIQSYISDERSISMDTSDPKQLNLIAIAAGLAEINPNQKHTARERNFEAISVLDILKSALSQKNAAEKNPNAAPEFVHNTLKFEADIIYLAQLHENFVYAYVLDQLSNISKAGLLTKAKMYFSDWEMDLNILNTIQLQDVNLWLDQGEKDREFLRSIGASDEIDSNVKKLLGNMQIVDSKPSNNGAPSGITVQRHSESQKLILKINRVLAAK